MNFNLFFSAIGILLFCYSCSSEQKDAGSNNLHHISKLTCEATFLRKARFALADSIRYYQDSILHSGNASTHKVREWESRLKIMLDRKSRLTAESRDLADTIRVEVLSLTEDMSTEEKRKFNERLQKTNCP